MAHIHFLTKTGNEHKNLELCFARCVQWAPVGSLGHCKESTGSKSIHNNAKMISGFLLCCYLHTNDMKTVVDKIVIPH